MGSLQARLETTDAVKAATEAFLDARRALERTVMGESFVMEDEKIIPPKSVAKALSRITDQWLLNLWNEAAEGTAITANMVAVGGYGREELSWFSDVDLVLEVDESTWESPELAFVVERFMAWCREPRVKVAHAVRSENHVEPEFSRDFRTAVSYLDARNVQDSDVSLRQKQAATFLSGDHQGMVFVGDLMDAYRQRLARFGQTIYRLEPELKSGPGGLRDLHAVRWGALVRWGGLHAAPGVSEEDIEDLDAALEWILSVRQLVHLRHGRKHDRLNFPDQEWLAERLKADGSVSERAEILMRAHYGVAKSVSRLTERLLRLWGAQDSVRRILHGSFFMGETTLGRSSNAPMEMDEVLDALALASEHELFIDARLETQMLEGIRAWPKPTDDQLQSVRRLLFDPTSSSLTATRLLDLGILVRCVPEFEPLICHVQHDVYHVYTTDIHSVRCMEAAREVLSGRGEMVARWPRLGDIAKDIQPHLFLASCLFHDIGKNRGGGHAEKGARMMPDVGPRLGFSPSETDTLAFLVREHLTLSHVARRRDTQDPRLIRDLAHMIRSVDVLKMLTVLTFCDMATVGDNVLTDWNASLLLGLYGGIESVLLHGAEEAWRRNEIKVNAIRDELLAHSAEDKGAIDRFLRDVPASHVVETSLEALTRQLQIYEKARKSTPLVEISPLEAEGITEVIVAGKDEVGALAKITGTISAAGLTILAARIVTTHSGRTLDIFQVAQSSGPLGIGIIEPIDARRVDKVKRQLEDVLAGKIKVDELLKRRLAENKLGRKPTPAVSTGVDLLELSDSFTVLEVSAEDRVGLLYDIARTLELHRVNIHLSKIDSLGTQVVDTFYVEELTGGPLSPERVVEVSEAIENVLKSSTLA